MAEGKKLLILVVNANHSIKCPSRIVKSGNFHGNRYAANGQVSVFVSVVLGKRTSVANTQ